MSWLLGRFGGSSDAGGGGTEDQPDGNDTAQNTKSTGKNNVSEPDLPLQCGCLALGFFQSIRHHCFAGCNFALPSCRKAING